MKDVLGHDSALVRQGTTWANKMNFVMNHTHGTGSLNLWTSSPASYDCTTDAPYIEVRNIEMYCILLKSHKIGSVFGHVTNDVTKK